MKEAMFWTPQAEGNVRCTLCCHQCLIRPTRRGLCGVRENRNGKLFSLVYERVTSEAVDPIEKKPLYHFLPGTTSFSIATRGCNFRCLHCQNCDISQVSTDDSFDQDRPVSPRQIVQTARAMGCQSISYTYTEPTIYFEYAYDTARIASENGLKNVFVTNGYIMPDALRLIAPYLDGANIDLKFFSDKLYREVCGARLQPVLDAIKLYNELGIWIEVTTLVIPSYNDSEEALTRLAEFIAEVSLHIPWHVTAFYPMYKLTGLQPTELSTLRRAREIGLGAGLKYVYTGNLPDYEGSTTRCPGCRADVVKRMGFGTRFSAPVKGECPQCGYKVEGVWEKSGTGSPEFG